MPLRTPRHRDRYLRAIAAEPFFRGVPRHLITVVGRTVDPFALPAGAAAPFDPAREAMLVTEGLLLVTDPTGRAVAAVGPLGAISGDRRAPDAFSVVAASAVRGFVVPRRELAGLANMAPRVASALARPVRHEGQDAPHPAQKSGVRRAESARASARASRS